MSVSRRFCSIWKIRSCFRRPDEPSILRPSAISWSSVTDFRFSSAISTLWRERRGRDLQRAELAGAQEVRRLMRRRRIARRTIEEGGVVAPDLTEGNGAQKRGQV